jgi:hypothetical protein
MAARGLSDLVCIPLQVLRDGSTHKQINAAEERWIARFNAIQQGYNTRHASSKVSYAPHVGGFAHRRLFGWHDMHKRLLTLQVARDTGRLRCAMYPQAVSQGGCQDNVLAFFSSYKFHTLAKMYAAVALNYNHSGQLRPLQGRPIAGSTQLWKVRLDTIAVVQAMLDEVLSARVSRSPPRKGRSCWRERRQADQVNFFQFI